MRLILFPLLAAFAFLACHREADQKLPCSEVARKKAAAANEALAVLDNLSADASQEQAKATKTNLETTLKEAFALSQSCRDSLADFMLSDVLIRMGKSLMLTSEYAEARSHFEQALQIRRRLFASQKDHFELLRLYHNIGVCWQNEGKNELALSYLDTANVENQTTFPLLYLSNLIALGACHLELNELETTEKYLLDARNRIEANTLEIMYARMPGLLAYLSDCYRRLNWLQKAIQAGNDGIAFAFAHGLEKSAADKLAACFLNTGNAWQDSLTLLAPHQTDLKKQARDSAISLSNKAIKFYRTSSIPASVGGVWRNLGALYRRATLPGKANEVLSRALDNDTVKNQPTLLAEIHINRGETMLDLEAFDLALADFHQASRYLAPSWQPTGSRELPPLHLPIADRPDLMLNLSDIATAHLLVFQKNHLPAHLDSAMMTYDSLLQLANHLRGDLLSSDAKLRLAGNLKAHLRKAFEVSLALHREDSTGKYLERAFRLSEQSKAVTLLEAVRLNHFSSSLPPNIQKEEEQLQNRRTEIENELFEQGALAERKTELQNQWLENFEDWRRFQEKLKKEHSAYFQLRYAGADLSVGDIQKNLLADDQGLVEYFFNDSVLHIFLVTRENFTLKSVPVASTFPAEMDSLLRMVSSQQSSPKEASRICLPANKVWKTLLAPLGTLPKRLIIVPDQPFQLLPFEALLTGEGKGSLTEEVENQNFVLFKHDISYCFSANLLALMRSDEGGKSLKKAVAAFAPNFPERLLLPAQLPAQMTPEDVALLKPIPNGQEVQAINGKVCSEIFPKDKATKAAFFEACKKYNVVHAATHGFLNHREPNFNFIAFNQTDSFDARQILKLSELNAQEIQSELIVFSACETAAGKNVEGEGTMSMARGLAYAGVNSLISTLFLVRAQNNSGIFSHFYESLAAKKDGLEMDGALADAKRHFALASSNNYHPANWAAVVLIGDAKPPEIASAGDCDGFLFHPGWLGAAGGLIILIAWRRRSRRKK